MGHSQQVKHRVGRAAHGYVEGHGVQEGLSRGNAARQHAFVAVPIIFIGVLHHEFRGIFKQAAAVYVCGQNRSVARQ